MPESGLQYPAQDPRRLFQGSSRSEDHQGSLLKMRGDHFSRSSEYRRYPVRGFFQAESERKARRHEIFYFRKVCGGFKFTAADLYPEMCRGNVVDVRSSSHNRIRFLTDRHPVRKRGSRFRANCRPNGSPTYPRPMTARSNMCENRAGARNNDGYGMTPGYCSRVREPAPS